jgi:hypothetical protein
MLTTSILLTLPLFAACGGAHSHSGGDPSLEPLPASNAALDAHSTTRSFLAGRTGADPAAAGAGWFTAGSAPEAYTALGDPTGAGAISFVFASATASSDQFGTEMISVDPTPYLGRRVRLAATVSAVGVSGWAGLWMRVDGANAKVLAFDNMQDRAITGTAAAARYSVVLDVAPAATGLSYGVLLAGQGAITLGAVSLEVVDASVPTTDLLPQPGAWFLAGQSPAAYTMSGDPTQASPGLVLSSPSAPASTFGTAMTQVDPAAFAGHHARLVATVETEGVGAWAGLWMRVDGQNGQVLAFDNMQDRPISGTTAAASYQVELEVASGATEVSYGVLLVGSGTVRVSNLTIIGE